MEYKVIENATLYIKLQFNVQEHMTIIVQAIDHAKYHKIKKKKNALLSDNFQYPMSKNVERGKSTPLTLIYDISLSWLSTGTSIKNGRLK